MKLLNDNIRLIEKFDSKNTEKAYVCELLDKPGQESFVRILDGNQHKQLIQDYIKNIDFYKSINHKGILSTIDFGLVKTLDFKESAPDMYYILSEYTPWRTLDAVMDGLSIHSRISILLKIIEALDYIHYRGITYDVLSPDKIFVSQEGDVKLLNIASTVHYKLQMENLKKTSDNMEHDGRWKSNGKTPQADFWSLGIVAEKLFSGIRSDLSLEKQGVLGEIIEDLMTKGKDANRKSLADHLDALVSVFDIDYPRDLRREREILQLSVLPKRNSQSFRRFLPSSSFDELYEKGYSGLIVEGNGGIGKKKYIHELFRRRSLEGSRTYLLEAGQGDFSSIDHFKAFIVQLCEALLIQYKIDPESNNMKIRFKDTFEVFRLDQLDSKLKLFNGITEEFVGLSKRKHVFFGLLNIHDADIEIFNLMDFIITKSRGKRIHFLFSLQNNQLSDTRKIIIVNRWLKNNLLDKIRLENLSKDEAEDYIHEILGNTKAPKAWMDELYNETLGNPRYIRVLVKHFFDNGVICIGRNGFWTTTTDDYRAFYNSAALKRTILRQIKTLDEMELKVLGILSCFNHPANLTTLINVLEVDGTDIGELIGQLTHKGIIKIQRHPETVVSFVDGDFKRQVYSDLMDEDRVKLHTRIADAILNNREDSHAINFDSLIYHLSESSQLDKMVELGLQRLENEGNRYNENSVNILSTCYGNLKGRDHPLTLMILKYLTEALLAQRRYTEGIEFSKSYGDLARKLGDSGHEIHADLFELEFIIHSGDYTEALEKITEYEEIAARPGNQVHRINLYKLEAIIHQVLDRLEESQGAIDRALELSHKHGIHQHDGDLYNLQGIGNYLNGDHKKALESYQRSLDTYVLSEREFDRIKPLNNIGNLYNEIIGDPQEALKYYFECLRVSDENGLSSFQTIALSNICDVYLTLRSYEDARTYIERTIELSHINGDRIIEFHGNVYKGVLELSLNNIEAASEIFLKVRELNKEDPILEKEVKVHYMDFLGRFYMELGDYNLGKMFTRNTMEKSEGFNPKLYFRSKSRMLTIDAIMNKRINQGEIGDLFKEWESGGNDYEKAAFLVEMMHISLHIPEKQGFAFLKKLYLGLKTRSAWDLFRNDFKVMNILVRNGTRYLGKAIDLLEVESKGFSQSICRYYAYVGELLYEVGDCKGAARYLIMSMDLVQTRINQVGIDGYREKMLNNYNIPKITSILSEIFKKEYGMELGESGPQAHESSLVGGYLTRLGYEQYNELFLNVSGEDIPGTFEKILSAMTSDHKFNLELMLKYLSREMGAKTSLINIYRFEESDSDSSLIYLGEKRLEIDQFVDKRLRSGENVVFNRDQDILPVGASKEYFDKSIVALMGVPVTEPKRDDLHEDRRSGIRKSRVLGYVYLETDSTINRFDEKRLALAMGMAKLIYLNLENRKLNRRANFDRLTNVLSRESIENEMEEVMDLYSGTEGEFAVLMMDIDKFKDINDTYGHQKGDHVLRIIGEVLNENTRSSDHVGRYGGEEFLILLENISMEDAESVAEEIRKAVQADRRYAVDRKVTISIGISHYPNHGTTKEDLIYKADQSLYYAKEVLGRNSVAMWDSDKEKIENIKSKTHKLSMEVFGRNQKGIVSLMDIAILPKSQEGFETKLFRFLGAINESIGAELSSALIIENGEVIDQFTRDGVAGNWIENKSISKDMVSEVLNTRESSLSVNWSEAVYDMGTVDITSLKSTILTPVLVGSSIKAIIYCESSLQRKDFSSADVMAVEVLSGVFSVNLV